MEGTVAEWRETDVADRRARTVAAAAAPLATYVDAADVQAADVLAARLRAQPVRYLDGGWQRLFDGLRTAVESAGARIVLTHRPDASRTTARPSPA